MDAVTLPVGTHPGWEHDESNGSGDSEASEGEPQELRSVAERYVTQEICSLTGLKRNRC